MNLSRMLNQQATYWASLGQDEYSRTSFAAPTTIAVRWEDTAEVIRNKKGDEYVSKSTVFCATDFALDGYLYNGVSAEADPRVVSGAHEIMQISKIPDLRSMQELFTAFL